ncbi:hypothetical protein F2Q69_00061990 [Brassica cretica]|uniref:Fatty acyl-CoA reductase n=1 Tax=Brassica cretica TaxID=69181 RepID=A0A8S9REN1_BRACR|nr:hypothetical protein F2Q69_00061990 [Brassica cretica]
MAISNLLATINAVSFFSGKPDHFLARPLSQTTPRIQTSCCHREPSFKPWTPIMMSEVETYTKSDSHGVGIFRFLQGKSCLITGATGFLAKVLILKLVRESPEIGNIFILMKTEDQESANKRLYDEIISSDLFRLIKQTHGSSYEALMKSKLIPVVGDIGEDNLGIKSQMAYNISDEIDVIISCAGRTTFDYRSGSDFGRLMGSLLGSLLKYNVLEVQTTSKKSSRRLQRSLPGSLLTGSSSISSGV